MKSQVIKRSIIVNGRNTSVSIEDIFWNSLKEIAGERGMTISAQVGAIEACRLEGSNLSSAVRVHVLSCFITSAQALAHAADTRRETKEAAADGVNGRRFDSRPRTSVSASPSDA